MGDLSARKSPVGRGWIIGLVVVEALILGFIIFHMLALR